MRKYIPNIIACLGAFGLSLLASTAGNIAQAAFEPCGGNTDKLWSWGWAGTNGSNVTLNTNNFGKEISYMGDLSGNGNHFSNDDPFNQNPPTRPAYLSSLSIGGWSTNLPLVGAQNYDSGQSAYLQYMFQPNDMVATGEFYLAFAGYDSRSEGERMIFGTTGSNFLRYDQRDNRLDITISGSSITLTPKNSWSNGPLLIEVWRDSANTLHAWVNGIDRTFSGLTNSSTFRMNGIGGGEPAGSGAFDDYGFEYIACDGLPSSSQRSEVREYMRAKWGLFGPLAPAPNPPSGLFAE